MPPEATNRTVRLERGDHLTVRMPGDAERAEFQLGWNQAVIEVWRASGDKEVYLAETTEIEVGPKENSQ